MRSWMPSSSMASRQQLVNDAVAAARAVVGLVLQFGFAFVVVVEGVRLARGCTVKLRHGPTPRGHGRRASSRWATLQETRAPPRRKAHCRPRGCKTRPACGLRAASRTSSTICPVLISTTTNARARLRKLANLVASGTGNSVMGRSSPARIPSARGDSTTAFRMRPTIP